MIKKLKYAVTIALSHVEVGKNCKEYQKLNLLWTNITVKE